MTESSGARSFLKFPVSVAGKQIIDTELRLYNYYSSTCSTSGDGVQVRRITARWNSATVSWSAQPGTTTAGAVTIKTPYGYTSSCPANYVRYDIDAIVQAWADGAPNYGLCLAAVTESDPLSWRRYRSSEYVSGDHYYEPHLTITYNSLPSTPTSLAIAPQFINPSNGIRSVTSATPTAPVATRAAWPSTRPWGGTRWLPRRSTRLDWCPQWPRTRSVSAAATSSARPRVTGPRPSSA